VLVRSRLFFQLAVIMAISGMVFECLQDILFNYLDLTLSFGAADNARVIVVLGISALLVQARPFLFGFEMSSELLAPPAACCRAGGR
jgi:hypothetical protein